MSDEPRYRDRDWLAEKYHGERMSQYEIAELCGVGQDVISKWMTRLDIPSRDRGAWRRAMPAYYATDDSGHERWEVNSRDRKYTIYVHRLIAVAEWGFDAVADDVDIHHENGIPWDNRPENLQLIDHAEHASLHAGERPEHFGGLVEVSD